jgi:phosphomannomutase
MNRGKSDLTGPDSGHIVLFDMDGTLTPARGDFHLDLMEPLKRLSNIADIGILTGSGLKYVQQQLLPLLNSPLRYKMHLLPCNGTIYYKPKPFATGTGLSKFDLIHQCDMRGEIGDESFDLLMRELISRQFNIIDYTKLPLTGHFIDYRVSTVNWCPIGRNASQTQRGVFKDYLKKNPSFREAQISILKERGSMLGFADKLTFKLGGDTSFDIYPKGWDKTYALRHFPDLTVWFVGDRCTGAGNDREIYDILKEESRAFETSSPSRTAEIIDGIIIPALASI